jgi:hypothetical protein
MGQNSLTFLILISVLADINSFGQSNYDKRLKYLTTYDSVSYYVNINQDNQDKILELFSLNQIKRVDLATPNEFPISVDLHVVDFAKSKCNKKDKGAECYLIQAMILPKDKKKASRLLIQGILNQRTYEIKHWTKEQRLEIKLND